jgi:hypothetical protein
MRGTTRAGVAAVLIAAVCMLAGCFPQPPAQDRTPPVLSLPVSFTVVATDPAGAEVSWTATATDAVDGPVSVTCTPPQGTFPLGTTSVTCSAADRAGNNASDSFDVTVTLEDLTPPVLSVPTGITAEATSPLGAEVTWVATASDAVDGTVAVECDPDPGVFPLGVTTVSCGAIDAAGNAATGTFDVTVVDTTAPTLTLPSQVTAAASGPTGAVVTWLATATDLVGGDLPVTCDPASGQFPVGTTTVSCTATDAAGNAATGTFDVTVGPFDDAPPTLALPTGITAEATGPDGAAVTWTATATDAIDGPLTAVCAPAPGTFPLGTTSVSCSATDAAGNTSSGSFDVGVVDTTPPALTLPSDITATAPDESGAQVTWSASASDLVDGSVAVTCDPAPGQFAVGLSEVSCSATDAADNVASGTFTVTVSLVGGGNRPPVIEGFSPAFNNGTAARPVPLPAILAMRASDPDGDQLTCALDVDDDGVFEQDVPNCTKNDPPPPQFPDQALGYNFPTAMIRTPGTSTVTLRVSDGVAPPVFATTTVEAAAATETFEIATIVEPGLLTASQSAALDAAVDRWEAVIGAGLPGDFVDFDPEEFPDGAFCDRFTGSVDDLTIRVVVGAIDGPGGIAGRAGYCTSRGFEFGGGYGRDLPTYGQLILDQEDLDLVEGAGALDDLVAHEIGHVLGIGTSGRWQGNIFPVDETDLRLFVLGGLELWRNYGGDGFPPVENVGQPGSILAHWRESSLGDELMTPFFSLSRPNPLSALSVSFLGEFGYSVDLDAADPFTPPAVSPGAPMLRRSDPTLEFHGDAFGPPPAPRE